MTIEFRVLGAGDQAVLARVTPGVFDHDLVPALSAEFLKDPRHHLAVAVEAGAVVGFASGVHYIHPDKPAELWVNEVGVSPAHQRQGLGRKLLQTLFAHAATLGCREAWVLTSPANKAAIRLYESAGGTDLEDPPVMFTFKLGGDRPA